MDQYPRTTRIPYIAPGQASVNEAQRKREMWQPEDHVPYLPTLPAPQEPILTLFERAIIMVTCLAVMAFVVVNFVIYYRVYVALQEVGKMLESVPGLGN